MSDVVKAGYQDCPWCGKLFSNLYGHAKTCKERPDGAELPRKQRRRAEAGPGSADQTAQEPRPATRKPRKVSKAVRPAGRAATKPQGGNGHDCSRCPGSPLCGMSVGEVQVVETAVRAGLSIEAAAKVVRMAQGAK